jgi:hypothetical protein
MMNSFLVRSGLGSESLSVVLIQAEYCESLQLDRTVPRLCFNDHAGGEILEGGRSVDGLARIIGHESFCTAVSRASPEVDQKTRAKFEFVARIVSHVVRIKE